MVREPGPDRYSIGRRRPGRGFRAWHGKALALVIGVAAATLFFAPLWPCEAGGGPPIQHQVEPADGTSIEPGGDALAKVQVTQVFSPLSAEIPLRLSPSGALPNLSPGSTGRLFYTVQRSYPGPLDAASVECLIQAGAADVLEHRLTDSSAERLRGHLLDFDESLRDLSLVIEDEERETQAVLVARPDRTFVFERQPREVDPIFPRFKAAVPSPKDGTLLSERLPPQGERVCIVLWSEWPALKQLYDDRFAMLADRRIRVRRWIESEYATHGFNSLFHG